MEETFRQQRKPFNNREAEAPVKPKDGIEVMGNIPTALQEAMRRHAEHDVPPPATASTTNLDPAPIAQHASNEMHQHHTHREPRMPEFSNNPKLMTSGNNKLDELLASIKEQVYNYEKVTLPSKGKFYDNTTAPGNGILHIRCMTGEEESILATPRHIKRGQAVNMIFRNCCRESIVPENLLAVDRTYLLIFLRGISYGTNYEVEMKCPECASRFTSAVDLDSLMVNYCPEEFGKDSLTDRLPTSKFAFSYRMASGRDESLITDYKEKRIRQFGEEAADDSWLYRASMLITDIEGLSDQMSIQTLITRLPISDVAYIRNVINDPPFGVDTKLEVLCPFCTEGFKVEMPYETGFFFPKPRKERNTPV